MAEVETPAIDGLRRNQDDIGTAINGRDQELCTGSTNFIASHPVPRSVSEEDRMRRVVAGGKFRRD